MALKRTKQDAQLDLFSFTGATDEHTHPIRTDGRETLARTLPEDGAANGDSRTAARPVAGGGGEDERRNGDAAAAVHASGPDSATGPRSGVGIGAGELHSAATRKRSERVEPPRNLNNYRISEADRLGAG